AREGLGRSWRRSGAREWKPIAEAGIAREGGVAAEGGFRVYDAIERRVLVGLRFRREDPHPPVAGVALHRDAARFAHETTELGRRLELSVHRTRGRGDAFVNQGAAEVVGAGREQPL